ncbi:MAG: hypothetical protein DRJ96_00525 [Thermoprotei archaeon]|nr:MAG: hypothetical protein DRJ96_00525 [Thermoprotei archaeon]
MEVEEVRVRDYVLYSLKSVRERRGRSVGAIIGVMIAATALALGMGIGKAFQEVFAEYLGKTLAASSIFVMNAAGLTDADVLIFSQLPCVKEAFGVAVSQATVATARGHRSVTIVAVDPRHLAELLGVADLNEFVEEGIPVPRGMEVVVGANIWQDQETGERLHRVGEVLTLRVGGRREVSLLIAGLAKPGGLRGMGFSVDDSIFMDPEEFFTLISRRRVYQVAVVILTKPEYATEVAKQVRALAPPRSRVFTPIGMVAQVEVFVNSVGMLLTFTSAVSMGVTALWVFDSMTISTVQRVREIGVLKAVGFTSRDVLLLFLTEALLISLAGEAAGLILSALLSRLVYIPVFNLRLKPVLTPEILALTLTLPVAANLAAAAIPARAAARLDPVRALRYE